MTGTRLQIRPVVYWFLLYSMGHGAWGMERGAWSIQNKRIPNPELTDHLSLSPFIPLSIMSRSASPMATADSRITGIRLAMQVS
jgi:hypothetical protein